MAIFMVDNCLTISGQTIKNKSEVPLFATVAMQGVGCELTTNFGRTPFVFDLVGMIQKTKQNIVK